MEKFSHLQAEDPVNIEYLRTLQSTVLQRKALFSEFENKKAELLENVNKLNRECYSLKMQLLQSYDNLKAIIDNKPRPNGRLLCVNETEYLGSSFLFVIKMLFGLRENIPIFQFFLRAIERQENIQWTFLEEFSEDLIFLFFADFTSSERNIIHILRQLKPELSNLFGGYSENRFTLLFDENLMVNKLIKAYFSKCENREYTQLMFGKLYEKAMDMERFISGLRRRKAKNLEVSDLLLYSNSEDLGSDISTFTPISKVFSIYISPSSKRKKEVKFEKKALFPELIHQEEKSDNLGPNEIILICEYLLECITKKLLYMPLNMRYLCKLIVEIAQKFSQPSLNRRRVIMDILFQKWWQSILMKPIENGIAKMCENEKSFSKQLLLVLKVFKAVLYGKPFDAGIKLSSCFNEYIVSKNFIVEKYLDELLDVTLPSLEFSDAEKKSSVSIKSIKKEENIVGIRR